MANGTHLSKLIASNTFIFMGLRFYSGSVFVVLTLVDHWIKHKAHHYVCVTGVHGLVESQRSPELRRIHNESGLTVTDGMPLAWVGRLMGLVQARRVYGPDLFLELCQRAQEKQYRVFLYGTTDKTLKKLKEKLKQKFPDILIVGEYAPPFGTISLRRERKIRGIVNRARPHMVFVGLSTPKQEEWMSRNIKYVSANVVIGVGAAFDFIAETKRQAPRWSQNLGLEWLFRLSQEPGRLWYRYLINNTLFLFWTIGFLGKKALRLFRKA